MESFINISIQGGTPAVKRLYFHIVLLVHFKLGQCTGSTTLTSVFQIAKFRVISRSDEYRATHLTGLKPSASFESRSGIWIKMGSPLGKRATIGEV